MISSKKALNSKDVALHYDELDEFYREVWGEHVHHGLWLRGDESPEHAARHLVERVAARANARDGARVCDIGCGYGATARILAHDFDADVTGLTISQAQYDFATSRAKHGSHRQPVYLCRDWFNNELPAESFDAAISVESSEHMADKAAFFAEARRVLRPGGRFVICAWLSKEKPRALETRWLLEPICREGRIPCMGTESDYRRFFETAGFTLDSFEDESMRVKKTWPICVKRFLAQLCRDPRYAKFLLNKHKTNRIFALTILRIWLAYNTGAMRYGIFAAHKPSS